MLPEKSSELNDNISGDQNHFPLIIEPEKCARFGFLLMFQGMLHKA